MSFGALFSRPLSVAQVLERADVDGHFVAVHGIFFYSMDLFGDEFVLLPKDGRFDGVGQDCGDLPSDLNILRVREPGLLERLRDGNVPEGTGPGIYNSDAIIVGRIKRQGDGPVLCDLWLMIIQGAPNRDMFIPMDVSVINFGGNRLPPLPWESPVQSPGAGSDLTLSPPWKCRNGNDAARG